MGLDLGAIIPRTTKKIDDFQSKTIAVDAFNTLYQFLAIIRQPDGTPLKDERGRVTSHLSGLLYRNANLLQSGIRPIYVFDGEPPVLKARTINKRIRVKERAEKEWLKALEEGDIRRARSKAMQTSKLSEEMIVQSKRLLELLGLPIIQAPSEGEAQASVMALKGEVFAVASQDYDSLLFGSPKLIRNLTITGRRKLPRKNIYVDVEPEIIDAPSALNNLNLTRERLVSLGILMGTDYNVGIKGIGPKKALALIQKYSTLKDVLLALGEDVENAREVWELFMNPPSTSEYEIQWRDPDIKSVGKLLCDEHNFSWDRISSALEKINLATSLRKQQSLDKWL